jgi:hypothetical protein
MIKEHAYAHIGVTGDKSDACLKNDGSKATLNQHAFIDSNW